MLYLLIVMGTLVCAIMAIRTQRPLISALWLAGTSALVALMMYLLGAPEVAVIELSVGAGLVTVLFVFAINIAGEEPLAVQSLIPRPVAWVTVIITVFLITWLSLPAFNVVIPEIQATQFSAMLWENRSLDVILQTILIFAGVLGVLGLLSEGKTHQVREQKS